jgi:AraC family transcriptional regulator, transcriptional activator of pobA
MIQIKEIEDYIEIRKARRVKRYVLIYCCSGELNVVVDENDFKISSGEVITITSGQIHYVKDSKQANGFVLEFTLDFFCKNDKDIELIFHNGLFCHFGMNEVITLEGPAVKDGLKTISEELNDQPYQYLISIHSRIELILVEINRAKVKRGDEIWKPNALFLKFLEAVRDNFENNYPLSHFANLLNTTELKLNELAKIHAGKTAQNVIYGLIASEAKRLLTYENLSVKEVAFKLGFKDQFYFSNFFKKQTQISPKAFQNTLQSR